VDAATPTAALKAEQLVTLGDLRAFMLRRGPSWWRGVPRVGIHRAEAIANWMRKHEASLGSIYTGNYVPSPTQLELPALARTSTWCRLSTPKRPIGSMVRPVSTVSIRFNFISAQNDLEAIRAYLDRFSDKPHTLRSYTKELERFLYWCVLEANKPLSSVLVTDCEAYKAFLKRPSARFVGDRAPRSSTRWRPSARNRSPLLRNCMPSS
jgi:hypothetical protein